MPGFGIISTVISASSNKSVFGQNGSLIDLFQLTQQTVFGKISRKITIFIYLFFNNPKITKTLSVRFSKPALNSSNNFFNSFKKYKMINLTVLYYRSYRAHRTLVFIHMIATAFLGFLHSPI
jgi:hypothetical protein